VEYENNGDGTIGCGEKLEQLGGLAGGGSEQRQRSEGALAFNAEYRGDALRRD
jgi:hypothetical protein